EKALKTANENKKLADNSFKQGYLQRADVLSADVRVNEVKNQLQTAKSNIARASHYLSFLMNDSNDVIYRPSNSLQIETFNIMSFEVISENRAAIKASQLATVAYKTMTKADIMSFLPRLNAFGSYELYDDEIFQGDAKVYIFGPQLGWTILDGTKRLGSLKKVKPNLKNPNCNMNNMC